MFRSKKQGNQPISATQHGYRISGWLVAINNCSASLICHLAPANLPSFIKQNQSI
jgi:hypothetical protein